MFKNSWATVQPRRACSTPRRRAGFSALPFTLLIVIFFSITACEPSSERQVELAAIHEKQAKAYLASGQYRAAVIEAQNVIQKAPSRAGGYILLAKTLNELGQYRNALNLLDQVPADTASTAAREFYLTKIEALLGRGKFASVLQTLAQHESSIPNRDALLSRARAQVGLGQLEDAAKTLRELRSIDPDNIDAMVAQADIALLQDNYDAANSLFEQISAKQPEHIDLRMLRAKMGIKNGDFAIAEKNLSDALIQLPQADTLTPKKATILSALADVLVKQGRSAEALVYTRVLAEAFPGFEVAQEKYREAVALFEKGKLDEAKAQLEALLAEYAGFDNAAVLLAVIQFQQGDFEKAADQLNDSVDPELVHPEITRMTALSNLRSNRPQQVLTMLDAFPGTQKDARLLTIYGTSAMALEQTEKGLAALQQAIKLEPGLTPAYIALAAHYNRTDPPQAQKALDLLRTAYAKNAQNPALAKRLVSQLVTTGNAREAEKIVSGRLSAGSKDLDTLSLAAAFYASQKKFDKAEQFYTEVLKQDPANYAAAVQQGIVAAVSGKSFAEALAKLKQAAAIAPERTNAYEYMLRLVQNDAQLESVKSALRELEKNNGQRTGSAVLLAFLSSRGDFDEASAILDTLNDSNTAPEILERARFAFDINKARQALAAENYDSAKQSVFSALRSRPQSPELLGMLGQIEIANKNYVETEKIISQVEAIDAVTALRLQGAMHEAKGDKAEAVKNYLEAWQQRPSERLATQLYAALEEVDPAKAEQFLSSWGEANPNSLPALSLRARNLLVGGQYRSAIPLMEKIEQRAPENVTNLNNLAWAYQQTNNKRAEEVAKKAFDLAPDSAAVADTYGWILYQKGKKQKAIEILERAARLDAANTEIADHLAKARAGA